MLSIPDGFAQLQSISFEEIDSLQRIEKEKRCFHSNWLVPIFHAMKTPKQEIIKELNFDSILLISMPKKSERSFQ
jgi:hypothetical protein